MAIEIDSTNEIEVSSPSIGVEGKTGNVAVTEGTTDLEVTVNRKEYSIVGDEVYIPKLYEDAPQWLKALVDVVVEVGVETNNEDLLGQVQDLINQLAGSTVPLNTFTQSILALNTEDSRLNSVIETLNSNYTDSTSSINAQILDVKQTYVSKEEASATVVDVISAEMASGALTNIATVGHVSDVLTTESDARSADYTALESAISGEAEATATAVQTINTYVGIDSAGASTGTGLSAYLESPDGTIGGSESQVANAVYIENGVPKSKWEYGSIINVGGVNYTNGFGIKAEGAESEFWIDASRMKFTNSNATGQATPFLIDATGTQPKVTFNGLVTFGSGQTGTIDEAIASTVETISVGDKNINITDNLTPTTSLVADTDNSGYQFIGDPVKGNVAGIATFAEPQVVLDGDDEVYSPYVDEVNLAYYFRFGIKGDSDLSSFKVVTIDASDNITYNDINVSLDAGIVLNSEDWYIVDGIINPYGGNTDDSGSVRDVDGTKLGTVNNIAMSNDAVKMLLGWQTSCTISRMKLAKITADTLTGSYATTDYVSGELNGLGSMAYEDSVESSKLGTTIVEGGYIKSNLITADNIVTGQLNADRISSTTGSSTVWTGGGLVSQNFNGNGHGSIGTPTTGFRLSSDAAGTSTDPNIYGAYIKGATLEGSALTVNDVKVKAESYPTNFGPLSVIDTFTSSNGGVNKTFPVVTSGYYRGSGYGSGYDSRRMCPNTLTVTINGEFQEVGGNQYFVYYILQRSIDGGAWTTMYTSVSSILRSIGTYTFILNPATFSSIRFRATTHSQYTTNRSRVVAITVKYENYGG